ncbi:MAG: hypothetical protein LBQ18_04005 [Campylobacteraceae bacterium]|jgi:hypothetical protein|nr:hypothetical protein [Campylobacteraceae bacterium]
MDKKAKQILFNTYWKNGGWIDKRHTPKEDFEYAKQKGVMFDDITITHDECIKEIIKLTQKIPVDKAVKAFIASLSTRRLELRSGLASYFLAKAIPPHKYKKAVSGHSYDGNITYTSHTCEICRDSRYGIIGDEKYKNEDLNVLNFERIKWGGVRHGQIIYMLFDLQRLYEEDVIEPTAEDIKIFQNILKIIDESEPNEYPGSLRDRLSAALKSSKNERGALIEILACVGVLQPTSYERKRAGKNDWSFAEYWRGSDGYNGQVVEEYFSLYV